MKVCFIDKKTNLSLGSYRIWIHDLNFYLNEIGIYSTINPKNVCEYDIVIYSKYSNPCFHHNKKIGAINPSRDNYKLLKKVDFIIVGSVEEKQSMIKYNRNCFIFPLIENMYLNKIPKNHLNKREIVIGYHGNQCHLNHMSLGLKNALERLSQEIKIKFLFTASSNKEWVQGRPNIPTEFRKWNINTIHDTLEEFDIGIVPNISNIEGKLNNNIKLGLYSSDIQIRFKNKSNIGRALVLFQLGIPVVADITPSNMHILADPDNGYAVLGEEGWYCALKELCCEKRRNFVSQNAYDEYKRLYNPTTWAKKLISSIENITREAGCDEA